MERKMKRQGKMCKAFGIGGRLKRILKRKNLILLLSRRIFEIGDWETIKLDFFFII